MGQVRIYELFLSDFQREMAQAHPPSLQEDDTDDQDTGRLANEMLAEFYRSISVDALNDAVHSVQSALELLSSNKPDPKQVIAYSALADAQYTLFRASNPSYLKPAISNLSSALTHV